MNKFIEELHNFVDREYDADNLEIRDTWSKPLQERVSLGEAIADITIQNVNPPHATLQCPRNISKFRPGDRIILHRSSPVELPKYKCTLTQDRDTLLTVEQGYKVYFDHDLRGSGWILDRQTIDIRFMIHDALEQLAYDQSVLDIIQGKEHPNYHSASSPYINSIAKKAKFNPSQEEAFRNALGSQNYYLIQGPPGTGKTYVLAYLASTLARSGQKVLVTAFTHRAINNALRKIAKVTNYPKLAKIGQTIRADDLTWKRGNVTNFEYVNQSPYSNDDAGFILGGTCFSLRSRRLKDIDFDTVIFDEAGQMPITLATAGMLSGDKYIFIGDHKQMAPIVKAEHKSEWVTKSIFETLFVRDPGTLLDITYRMNKEINRYPSNRFYQGKVIPSEEAKERTLELHGQPGKYRKLLEPNPSSIFIRVSNQESGMRSEIEAVIAAGIVREAIHRGLSTTEIAVIAPYRAQVRLIRNELLRLNIEVGGEAVIVDTVERIQGQEKSVIIFSLTTSKPTHAASRADFYFQPNRLNVAITRPKMKRIVIGDPRLFRAKKYAPEFEEWIDHFKGLYEDSKVFTYKSS